MSRPTYINNAQSHSTFKHAIPSIDLVKRHLMKSAYNMLHLMDRVARAEIGTRCHIYYNQSLYLLRMRSCICHRYLREQDLLSNEFHHSKSLALHLIVLYQSPIPQRTQFSSAKCRGQTWHTHTYKHTHRQRYIYIFICMYTN